jgi:hypothetical protein
MTVNANCDKKDSDNEFVIFSQLYNNKNNHFPVKF